MATVEEVLYEAVEVLSDVVAVEPQAARLSTMDAAKTELTIFFMVSYPPRILTAHTACYGGPHTPVL